MAPQIKNVAIAGATGNAGAPILQGLIDSKLFNITILTRSGSNRTFPAGVTIKEVDYSSIPSLTAALQGQHALINATYIAESDPQINLIDAAIAAGVYRYLPSEYGLDTNNPAIGELPIFEYAYKALKHMHAQCAVSSTTTYTTLHNGGFLDWCFETGFLGILPREKRATIYDEGDHAIAYSTREWVGRAVVGVLTHAAETENRAVFVANTYISQVDLLRLAQEVLGTDGWTVERKSTDEMLARSYEKLEAGDVDLESLLDFIRVADLKIEKRWEKDDNELLGIPRFGDEEVKEVLKQFA